MFQDRLAELPEQGPGVEETLDAIRSGEVDAIVVTNGEGRKVFTLEGADYPYRALVENIREGALTLSRTGTILYTNSRFAEMTKLSADKVTGHPLLDFVCMEYRPQIELALKEILNQSCQSQVRIHQGKGSLPVYISMNPLTADEDTKISVVVTDRRKDEEQLPYAGTHAQCRWGCSYRGRYPKQDHLLERCCDQDVRLGARRSYLGRDLVEVVTPEISHEEARKIAARLRKGDTWTREYIVHHRDGHEFPIHARDAPVFDDEGKLIAIIGMSHDISERKRTEEALHKSEEKFRILFTQMAEGSALHEIVYNSSGDPVDYRILDINPAFERILGLKREDVIGKTSKEVYRSRYTPVLRNIQQGSRNRSA